MAKKLWGGRFKKEIDKDFEEFSKSIQCDYKLAEYDIYHSIIHAQALKNSGILSNEETKKIIAILKEILKEIADDKFVFDNDSEDIHTEIQNRLEKKIGNLALKLHSLRSRNDQIVFDEKMYCMDAGEEIANKLLFLQKSLSSLAQQNLNQPFIGYTHTQRAQVVEFSAYLLSFRMMFLFDVKRLNAFLENLKIYIGAGALTGTSLSRNNYKKSIFSVLNMQMKSEVAAVQNALHNVSDRDFIIEFLSILSIIQMHLSRLAEDLILYSTKEFNYIDLPEEFCTGSSLMPHKKNPDFLELVRGYTGRIYGNLMSILTTMKGLPLAYNRDMQLDKEPLFNSVEIVKDELKIMGKFIKGIKLNKKVIEKALEDESLYATELAEFLVVKKGLVFKEAHDIVGRLIRYSEDKKIEIKEMPDKLLKVFHKELNEKVIKMVMNTKYAISSKKSISRKIPTQP